MRTLCEIVSRLRLSGGAADQTILLFLENPKGHTASPTSKSLKLRNFDRKDQTSAQILDILQRLEGKIDQIPRIIAQAAPTTAPWAGKSGSRIGKPTFPSESGPSTQMTQKSRTTVEEAIFQPRDSPTQFSTMLRQKPIAYKLLFWPAINTVLNQTVSSIGTDLEYLQKSGISRIVRMQEDNRKRDLPMTVSLEAQPLAGMQASRDLGTRVVFPGVTIDTMHNLSRVYFCTFNFLYPLLDQDTYYSQMLPKIASEGFGEADSESVMVLLVMALGKFAFDGSIGEPIAGEQSGIRGGSVQLPPGLEFFNEARRRMGFSMTKCELEHVQAFSLAAATGSTMPTAPNAWNLAFELDWPQTGIRKFEDVVPLPDFPASYSEDNQWMHFQYHFLAQISLNRLLSRINSHLSSYNPDTTDDFHTPPASLIREFARELDSWRSCLPGPLQWTDRDLESQQQQQQQQQRRRQQERQQQQREISADLADDNTVPYSPLFTLDHSAIPVTHAYSLDILIAFLRSRYCYTQYMIYRPFLYKALHFPDSITWEELKGCEICLRSCLRWPIAMSPPKDKKRLLPHLISWTHTFLEILLLFHMTTKSALLRRVQEEHFEPGELEESAALMLEWVRDMRVMDSVARWAWTILMGVYPGYDG
ncbi:MAG: hypothetical protein M1839_003861 [Geoglossum umbratile]|nr:MAG: hypothetical protein M1839_003861 [Geoglossum umbratile]